METPRVVSLGGPLALPAAGAGTTLPGRAGAPAAGGRVQPARPAEPRRALRSPAPARVREAGEPGPCAVPRAAPRPTVRGPPAGPERF